MMECNSSAVQKEKASLQRSDFSATTTKHIADFARNRDAEKCFSTWCSHTLNRTASLDSAIRYLTASWGLTRELPTLDAGANFYAQIGGKK